MLTKSTRKQQRRTRLRVGDRTVTISAFERKKDGRVIGFRAKVPSTHKNGEQQYQWVSGKTIADVFAQAEAWLEQNPDPSVAPTKAAGQKVGAWFEWWLDNVIKRPAALKPSADWAYQPTTYFSYRASYLKHIAPRIGGVQMRKLTQAALESMMDDLEREGVGRETRRVAIKVMHAAFASAIEVKHRARSGISVDPARYVHGPKSAKRRHYTASLPELLHLIDQAEHLDLRMAAIPVVTVSLGLRRGEILGLTWGDIDFEARQVTLRRQVSRVGDKTVIRESTKKNYDGPTEPLELSQMAVDALRLHQTRLREHKVKNGKAWRGHSDPCAPGAPVFPTFYGDVMGPGGLTRWFNSLCERAGLGHHVPRKSGRGRRFVPSKTLHKLRHDCASFHRAMGTPDDVIQRIMRHKDPGTLAIYTHLTDVHGRRVGADNMDQLLRRAAV